MPITSSWGMTETSRLVACSRLGTAHDGMDEAGRRAVLSSPGPNVPLTELRLVGDDGQRVEHDGTSPGELQVAGPTVASGYFGSDAGLDAFTEDGWLRTGDVATIDTFGHLQIVDRTKDLVKSGGEWISSVALENEIMAQGVREAAVVGVPDRRWGERPVACVDVVPGRVLRRAVAARAPRWSGGVLVGSRTPSSCWTRSRRPRPARSPRWRCGRRSPTASARASKGGVSAAPELAASLRLRASSRPEPPTSRHRSRAAPAEPRFAVEAAGAVHRPAEGTARRPYDDSAAGPGGVRPTSTNLTQGWVRRGRREGEGTRRSERPPSRGERAGAGAGSGGTVVPAAPPDVTPRVQQANHPEG